MATETKTTTNLVFRISLLLTGGIALWAVAFNDSFTVVSNAIFTFLTRQFGWLYQVAMLFFVIFILAIAMSKWGHIRLGPDDARPEYSTVSWFAMLFGAGMGVGLVDCMGTLCGHLHCADLPGPYRPGVHHRCGAVCHGGGSADCRRPEALAGDLHRRSLPLHLHHAGHLCGSGKGSEGRKRITPLRFHSLSKGKRGTAASVSLSLFEEIFKISLDNKRA